MNVHVELAAIAASRGVVALRDHTMAAYAAIGFGGAYFLTPVTTDRRFGRIIAGIGIPEGWIAEYQQGLRESDPMPDLALRIGRPFRWSEAAALTALTRTEQAFMARAAAFGMHDGIACVTHGPSGRIGFVGITFPAGDAAFARETVALGHAISEMSFLRYCELLNQPLVADVRLSGRERDVLRWMARGKSNSVIADILGISAETVDSYVRRVFAKLDVADRTSAVLRAVLGGHLFIGDYRESAEADGKAHADGKAQADDEAERGE
ncbi:helix-turn-helix transcriptional regulator [Novosphingobium album (ex Liu et al. 2023)]|uniref:LuxR C-terminal-related transcriptional regulator n=1 Tax=Novosphingobium album (ex Liu et al. 2023) TaxID=3031130 RepID=A0ABT5WSY3_9SPHN|nr:LuxR family transcriptional regulator [Novosphingobium album (ex Liu et al. 2023)]MDE8653100.1 LuxR C-terminal-related transcriptional regulator [Novosphingobium album (ex Liu et al. 2023)]